METEPEKKPVIKIGLARVLGLADATFIGVGAIIGGGIFTLTGMAMSFAGPSLILVIVLNGVIAFMTALAYAELGSAFPEAGGGFIWVKKGLGNLSGHISGWISWFAHAVACGLYALSFSFYCGIILSFFILPPLGISISFSEGGFLQKIFAIAIIFLIGIVNFKGVSNTGRFGKTIVYLEIAILSVFTLFGLISFFKRPDLAASFTPLFPAGLTGFFSAAGLMYIGFEGTEIIVQSGEELKNPRKNVPRAIFLSLGIICILYLVTIFSALAGVHGEGGIQSWQIISESGQGALVQAARFFMPGFEWIIILGGLLAAGGALNATVFSSSHVSFAMGRAGSLPKFLSKIHQKNKTPYISVIASTILVLIIAVFLPLKEVAAITDLLFIFLFIQLHLALISLRKKMPEALRPFRVPLYPIPSLVAIFAYALLIYQLFHISPLGLAITLFWVLSGFLIYFGYSKPIESEKIEREIVFEEKIRVTEKKKYQILLPLRPDPNWPDILSLAIALAKQKDAEIHILYIQKVPKPLPLEIKKERLEEKKLFLEEAVNLTKDSGVNISSTLMVSRRISGAIIDVIQKDNPNLLILHWKGYTKMIGAKPKIFGRNLDRLLRQAKCDLIVAQINQPSDLKNILLPSTRSSHTKLTGEAAGIISGAFGSKVKVIYITTHNETKKINPEEKLKNIIVSLAIPANVNLKSEVILAKSALPQAIAYEIIQESRDFGCILMSSAKNRLFQDMIFGNILEIVARNSKKSLILIKHHSTIAEPIVSYFSSKI